MGNDIRQAARLSNAAAGEFAGMIEEICAVAGQALAAVEAGGGQAKGGAAGHKDTADALRAVLRMSLELGERAAELEMIIAQLSDMLLALTQTLEAISAYANLCGPKFTKN